MVFASFDRLSEPRAPATWHSNSSARVQKLAEETGFPHFSPWTVYRHLPPMMKRVSPAYFDPIHAPSTRRVATRPVAAAGVVPDPLTHVTDVTVVTCSI